MISHDCELCTTEIVVKLLTTINDGEELALRTAILAFSVTATLTCVRDNMVFRIFLLLFEYC